MKVSTGELSVDMESKGINVRSIPNQTVAWMTPVT